MQYSIFSNNLNFRQNDKKIRQKIVNSNILMIPRQILGDFSESTESNSIADEKKKSIATANTSKSKGKEGRLLLRDYLYLTNKNFQRNSTQHSKSKDKKQIRKQKYKLDEEKIFYLMQDEMKAQLNQVIERLQKMKQNFKDKSLKDDQKNNKQNIALIYSIKSIIKDKFRKGIQDINIILFEQESRKFQLRNDNLGGNIDTLKSDNCLLNRQLKKKEHKISLQMQKNPTLKYNSIPINGNKFMADFV